MKTFLRSESVRVASMLAGAIIGVGIFGVPYVFSQAGVGVSTLLFAVLAAAVLMLHIMFAEVIERSQGTHRLVGYAARYFGRGGRIVATISVVLGTVGALVAYLLVAGHFLAVLLSPISANPLVWQVVFWIAMSGGILLGVRTVARMEVVLVGVLVALFALLVARSAPEVRVENLLGNDLSNIFLPYGVILFALIGIPAIPEIRSTVSSHGPRYRNALIAGTLIPVILTYIFAMAVVGVSGDYTSQEAISGLIPVFGPFITFAGALVGVLAIATSFLVFGLNLRDTLLYDWKMPKSASDALTVGVPIFLIFLGVHSIVEVLSFTGAVFGAIDGTLVVLLFREAKKRGRVRPAFSLRLPPIVYPLLIGLLVVGGVYSLVEVVVR